MSGLEVECYFPLEETRFASKVFTQVRNIHPTSDEYQPNQ